MFRFTIRDVLWLMVVMGLTIGWWADRNGLYLRRGSSNGPLVVLAKKTKAAHVVSAGIAGSYDVAAYEYGEATLHNRSSAVMHLPYGMSFVQYFTPVIRLESGEVVSTGQPLGRVLSVLTPGSVTIAPGQSHKVELTMWDQALSDGSPKSGRLYLRVQFHYDGKMWESNEIMLTCK